MTAKKLEVIQGDDSEEIQVNSVSKQNLIELILSNKATAQQKQELARMLEEEAKAESQNEFNAKIQKVKDLMEVESITLEDLISSLKEPAQPIFVWVDSNKVAHQVFGPMKGKPASWIAEMKVALTVEQATELAHTEAGKAWIKKIYSK